MGTWSLPNTKEKAEQIVNLMKEPLQAQVATKKLSNLYGDDSLFDEINYCEDVFGHEYDVRGQVYHFIKKLLLMYWDNPESFYVQMENDAIAILKSLVKGKF